ncbi:MAG: hypothetical protein II886_11070 [Prevotella sp.]|nr:hypothetical protein [Prevotella sp.]
MKKFGVIAIVACAALMIMGSCGSGTQQVSFDNGDSAEVVNADPTVYGVCGEATAMNTLQLITDMGDTLTLDISTAQENGQVFGGLEVGDRLAVIPNTDRTAAELVINQASLLGNWVMPNPIDGSGEVGISIKEGGIVESIQQSNITYKTWRLSRGKLEIVLVREGGSEDDEVYLYDIEKLGADSLVIKDAEETLEYTRQKPKEDYGVDIKLEDAQSEFFM